MEMPAIENNCSWVIVHLKNDRILSTAEKLRLFTNYSWDSSWKQLLYANFPKPISKAEAFAPKSTFKKQIDIDNISLGNGKLTHLFIYEFIRKLNNEGIFSENSDNFDPIFLLLQDGIL